MNIYPAVGCGINSKTSEDLTLSLYWLPRKEPLKTEWKQKLRRGRALAHKNTGLFFLYFKEGCFE